MKSSLVLLIAATFGPSIQAQSPAPTNSAAPSQPPACVSPEFRQFDFWLGKWKVIGPQGKQAGTSEITRVSEGCALREQWTAASGKGGMSINYYDSADREWHQDWVGGDGTILHLHGGLKDGAMVLDGTARSPKGPYLSRITWTPLEGGKVKQEWSISTDNGTTWKPSFVGIYEKLL